MVRRLSVLRDNRGSGLVEKPILIALGALALIVGVTRFSGSVKKVFGNSGRTVENLRGAAQVTPEITALPKMDPDTDPAQNDVASGFVGKAKKAELGGRQFDVPASSLEAWSKSILMTVDNLKLAGHSPMHKVKNDCEMHYGGMLDGYQGSPNGIVLEPMNLCVKPFFGQAKYSAADWIAFADKITASDVRVSATGVTRIWPEHMGASEDGGAEKGGEQVADVTDEAESEQADDPSNPDHVLELHPLTEVSVAGAKYDFANFIYAGAFNGGIPTSSAEQILTRGKIGVVRNEAGSVHIDAALGKIGNFSVLSLAMQRVDVKAGKQPGGHRFDGDVMLEGGGSVQVRLVTVTGSPIDDQLEKFAKSRQKALTIKALCLLSFSPEALAQAASKSTNGARVVLTPGDRPFQLIVFGTPDGNQKPAAEPKPAPKTEPLSKTGPAPGLVAQHALVATPATRDTGAGREQAHP